ncbi:MAG: hypothetical protein KAU26_05790, partial [Methylococcales bacterium]|nr:hypothetical protein [Methylococcales bacterium]
MTQALQCYVHIDEDVPPTFDEKENESTFKQLFFNLTRLHKEIKTLKKTAPEKNDRFNNLTGSKLPCDLLSYLNQCWLGKLTDESPCFIDRLDRLFTIGLENTYRLLCSNAQAQHDPLEYLAQSCSPKGLSYLFNESEMLSIGSLISFRKIGSQQNQRLLGVVSRIMTDKPKSYYLEFNVSLISSNVHAVSFSFQNKEGKKIVQKALFYQQKQEKDDNKSFLIINTYVVKEQAIIDLQLFSKCLQIKLSNKKNIGLSYWQFECKEFI